MDNTRFEPNWSTLTCRYSSAVNSAVLYCLRLVEPASTEAELRILRVREYGGTVDKGG